MSGIAAFPKSQELRDIFAAAPVDRVLVETDSPYLAPPPHRGKRNEPAYVAHTARIGAEASLASARWHLPPRPKPISTGCFPKLPLGPRPCNGKAAIYDLGLRFVWWVPRIGGQWGACDPDNPKNTRLRCSMLVERETEDGTTTVLIDTSPDLRQQLLTAGVGRLDGVIYTHGHADHVHGLDDLRMIVFNMRARLPVWADPHTSQDLISRFGYTFVQPEGSAYPPILDLHPINGPVTVDGPGGAIEFHPFEVEHGAISSLGFRIEDLAYLPDVSAIPAETWPMLEGLDCWIVDALRREPHPTHAHLARTLEWIERAKPRRALLTNMHIDLDFATVLAETPDHISPAYDGLQIGYEL